MKYFSVVSGQFFLYISCALCFDSEVDLKLNPRARALSAMCVFLKSNWVGNNDGF